jgi:anti-sigma regulatory factor (Ser/Thr protein kinase)
VRAEAANTSWASLPASPSAAREARRLVARQCGQWAAGRNKPDLLDTAQLLTSELVTNAVIHGRSHVRLGITVSANGLRIAVADDNSRHPTPQPADPDALDGRGLQIVERLASSWGVDDNRFGKTVWFELTG